MGSQLWGNKMPLTKKGKKVMKSMKGQYGEKKGEQVFYATKNKGKLKGVDMKKAKKYKGGGDLLANLSPAYSLMKGKGVFNDMIKGGGIAGVLAKQLGKDDKDDAVASAAAPSAGKPAGMAEAPKMMYGGGAVKRSRPIDGIATKGKTKGRMC
jgi:hypothetical protein